MINSKTLKQVKEKLKIHHTLYRFPVKAELWEDIFDQCINGDCSDWIPGGHDVGTDVLCETTGTRYQNKGGEVNLKKGTITWSGHRTTSHRTINDKIKFISQKHCDEYVMLARNKKEWVNGNKIYYLINFNSSLIDYSKLNWSETYSKKGKLSGWVGKNDKLPYSAKISLSMSAQLWTECSIDYLENIKKITIL
jgi:hypothetical protein